MVQHSGTLNFKFNFKPPALLSSNQIATRSPPFIRHMQRLCSQAGKSQQEKGQFVQLQLCHLLIPWFSVMILYMPVSVLFLVLPCLQLLLSHFTQILFRVIVFPAPPPHPLPPQLSNSLRSLSHGYAAVQYQQRAWYLQSTGAPTDLKTEGVTLLFFSH